MNHLLTYLCISLERCISARSRALDFSSNLDDLKIIWPEPIRHNKSKANNSRPERKCPRSSDTITRLDTLTLSHSMRRNVSYYVGWKGVTLQPFHIRPKRENKQTNKQKDKQTTCNKFLDFCFVGKFLCFELCFIIYLFLFHYVNWIRIWNSKKKLWENKLILLKPYSMD